MEKEKMQCRITFLNYRRHEMPEKITPAFFFPE
jgi:hypothetical protein